MSSSKPDSVVMAPRGIVHLRGNFPWIDFESVTELGDSLVPWILWTEKLTSVCWFSIRILNKLISIKPVNHNHYPTIYLQGGLEE